MSIKKTGVISTLVVFGSSIAAFAGVGNNLPSGPRYNLELIAKKQCTGDALKGTGRHVIFLQANFSDANVGGSTKQSLDRTNKIMLNEGDFSVADGNACDGDGAAFQLPAGGYKVYIRPVGKPGTALKMTTCGFEAGADGVLGTADDTAVCSTANTVQVRTKGGQKFSNVTSELTTLSIDINGDGVLDSVGLFDPRLMDYFWSADATGQAHVQIILTASGS